MASITHNIDDIIKRLNLIEKLYLPAAANKAWKSLGLEARKLSQDEMKSRYKTTSNYTLRSPYFKHSPNKYALLIGISDKGRGTAPNRYLAPTDRAGGIQRKPIAATSFAGALRARYGIDAVPVPIRSSRAGRLFLDKSGNLRGRKVQNLLKHLESPSSGDHEQYFLIKPSDSKRLKAGVYRRYRIKNALSMAFSLPDQRPTQQTSIDFHTLIKEKAAERLPILIREKLARLLA